METFYVKLKFNPHDFWDMYYPNGQSSLLINNNNRKVLLNTAIPAILMIIVYFISFNYPGISWLLVLGGLITFGFALYAVFTIVIFLRRKKDIKSFIKDLSQYSSFYLSATDNAIEIGMDAKITIDKWNSIKSAQLEESHITLFNEAGALCIFPAKSMRTDEFVKLKEFIKAKIL